MTNLRGVPYAGNGIYLFWDIPDEPNGLITGYQIDYKTIERYLSVMLVNECEIDLLEFVVLSLNQVLINHRLSFGTLLIAII